MFMIQKIFCKGSIIEIFSAQYLNGLKPQIYKFVNGKKILIS